nr:dual specificity protein phosphatase 22 isoform X1 [Podarcis muralis]
MARGKPGSGQPALVGAPPPRLQKDRRAAGKGPDPSPPSSLPKQERSPDSVRCAPRGAIPSISSLSFRSPAPERGHPLPGARLALFFLFRRTLQGRSQAVLKAHASPSQPMIQASLLRRGKEGRAARLSDLPSGRDRQGQISEERFQCGNGWRRELLKGRGGTRRKILPGLFLGNFKDARDTEQLKKNNITHILSIHDSARPMLEGVKYLCIPAADSPSQNLVRHFKESIEFIHECRLGGQSCLVHCLAGVSRSATLVVAYIMTITDLGWEDALSVVRASRSCANPNAGFQRQLEEFEKTELAHVREWLRAEYGESPLQDKQEAQDLLQKFKAHAAAAAAQSSASGRQWNDSFASVASLSMPAPQ